MHRGGLELANKCKWKIIVISAVNFQKGVPAKRLQKLKHEGLPNLKS